MKHPRITKLQIAVDALRAAHDDVSGAQAIVTTRISARTWYKAIEVRRSVSPVPVLSRPPQRKAKAETKLLALNLTGDGPKVKARQRVEQTIALVAAQALLDAGLYVGVYDGEEVTLTYSRDIAAIQKALFTTDEDYLYIWEEDTTDRLDPTNVDYDPRPNGWVRLVYGNDGWDVISDYFSTSLLNKIIGDGTAVQKLIDHASEFGTVPDLYLRDGKVTV